MARRTRMSPSTVHRIWAELGYKPHRTETFKFSTDPALEAKVRDVVGLYLDPPDGAVVLCVDEKTQIQALDRTQPQLPMRPGQVERHTHDYTRHGTTWARTPPADQLPLHPDLGVLDEPGRDVVRDPDPSGDPPGQLPERPELVAMIDAFTRQWNAGASPFTWVRTPDEILAKAVRKPRALSESGH